MHKAILCVPIADLRREPIEPTSLLDSDPLQETQLLFGEKVTIWETQGEWSRVEAIEQQKFHNGKWQGYPGWIKSESLFKFDRDFTANYIVHTFTALLYTDSRKIPLSYGTRLFGVKDGEWVRFSNDAKMHSDGLRPIGQPFNRQELLDHGKYFLGLPYLWGGRSYYYNNWRSSVDCSGLVHLLYSVQGINLPRDAHDQYLKSQPVKPSEMQIGDLIFMASVKKPERMTHVMLYAGNDVILEATGDSKNVRETSIISRLNKPMVECQQAMSNGEYIFYFSRFF